MAPVEPVVALVPHVGWQDWVSAFAGGLALSAALATVGAFVWLVDGGAVDLYRKVVAAGGRLGGRR